MRTPAFLSELLPICLPPYLSDFHRHGNVWTYCLCLTTGWLLSLMMTSLMLVSAPDDEGSPRREEQPAGFWWEGLLVLQGAEGWRRPLPPACLQPAGERQTQQWPTHPGHQALQVPCSPCSLPWLLLAAGRPLCSVDSVCNVDVLQRIFGVFLSQLCFAEFHGSSGKVSNARRTLTNSVPAWDFFQTSLFPGPSITLFQHSPSTILRLYFSLDSCFLPSCSHTQSFPQHPSILAAKYTFVAGLFYSGVPHLLCSGCLKLVWCFFPAWTSLDEGCWSRNETNVQIPCFMILQSACCSVLISLRVYYSAEKNCP